MEENMNLNTELETQTENTEEAQTAEVNQEPIEVSETEKPQKTEKPKKEKKPKKLKNQAFLKKGGYSVALTALVIAGVIILNWLILALSSRVNLEFDMSTEKINSMSEENIKYIKNLKDDIKIIVCGQKEDYPMYMSNYASQIYGAYADSDEYYEQTVNLTEKYGNYSDKIEVTFMNTQSTEFTEISQKYSNSSLAYGDIIVTDGKENGRFKKIGFTDIYQMTEENNGYYSQSVISGNNLESALTGAISYVIGGVEKKAAVISGHSSIDNAANYKQLLTDNSYDVSVISDSIIGSIDKDINLIAIMSPDVDFTESEIDVLSDFLDNDGKLGKGIVYFADASCPYLPNISGFLAQWGIDIKEGLLMETDAQYQLQNNGIYMLPDQNAGLSTNTICVAGYNVPMSVGTAEDSAISVSPILNTATASVVIAPIGADETYNDYTKDDLGQFVSCIKSEKKDYNDKNEEAKSYIYAFSSIQFIQSEWAEYNQLSNKNIVLSCSDTASNTGDTGISFISKTITNESFSDSVTAGTILAYRTVFMILLPLSMIAIGIIIFVRRKNAQ